MIKLHQPHDRSAGLVDLFLGARPLVDRFGKVDRRIGEFLQHRVGALADRLAVVAVDRLEDVFPGGQGNVDLAVENEPQLVEGVDVHRIADDDRQPIVLLRQGDNGVLPDDGLGNQLDDRGRNRHLVEVDVVQAMLLGHRPHDLFPRGIAEADQGVGQLHRLVLGHLPASANWSGLMTFWRMRISV